MQLADWHLFRYHFNGCRYNFTSSSDRDEWHGRGASGRDGVSGGGGNGCMGVKQADATELEVRPLLM
jgi:hypothetical protein